MRLIATCAILPALFATLAAPARADGHSVTARVGNLRSAKGSLFCRLYDRGDRFLKEPARDQKSAPIADHSAVCTFTGVPAGEYAIAVFHDENGNSTLDRSFLGIPKEGVGASNNHLHAMGPPKWDESKFTVGGDVALDIRLRY